MPGSTLNFGLGATCDRSGGTGLDSGIWIEMQYEEGEGSWNLMQDNAQISARSSPNASRHASSTFNWTVPTGSMGGVLKIRAVTDGAYPVEIYYTYTYQAAGTQPASATNVPPQQTGVDHLTIAPLNPPTEFTSNQIVYTYPPTKHISAMPIIFRVIVYGSGSSQVPDGTEVDFRLVDYDGNAVDAYVDPEVGHTTNSEVQVTFYPPTNAYWNSHDPSAEGSSNSMTIYATCEGKQTSYDQIKIKPYSEPSAGSTSGSTTF